MNIFLLLNDKMPTSVGILTFMIRKNSFLANLSLKNPEFLDMFFNYEHFKFHSQLS